jgi:hypothetical protein
MILSLRSLRQKKTRALYHARSLSYFAREVRTFEKKRLYLWRPLYVSITRLIFGLSEPDRVQTNYIDNIVSVPNTSIHYSAVLLQYEIICYVVCLFLYPLVGCENKQF